MLVTASQVADTLRLLVPGFVMMKTFYVFGLQTKRSDAEWAIWSLLAAVPVNALAHFIDPLSDPLNFVLALIAGVLGGVVLTGIWKGSTRVWPTLAAQASIHAWDVIFSRPTAQWLQLELHDGRILSGYADYPARSVETDDLDLYLRDPNLVVNEHYQQMPGVEGILIARSEISTIAVIQPPSRQAGAG
jgi:hypothetical protein